MKNSRWDYNKIGEDFKITFMCEVDFKNTPQELKDEIEKTFEKIRSALAKGSVKK